MSEIQGDSQFFLPSLMVGKDKVVPTNFFLDGLRKDAKLYPDLIGQDDKNFTEVVESIEKTAGIEE